jgi:protein phosphatase
LAVTVGLQETTTSENRAAATSHAVLTDVGRIRERNEDLALIDVARGVYLLADGMGGHPDGNLAAKIAVETAMHYLTAKNIAGRPRDRGAKLGNAIREANRAILERSSAPEGAAGMGTTLACVWLGKRFVHVAHVGDSRVYRIREGAAERLTRDHTVVQALVDRGELTAGAPEVLQLGHILTQAVGLDEHIDPEVNRYGTRQGDVYLLCSDGLSDLVPDAAIAAIVTASCGDLRAAVDSLVATALGAGGHDNVTVVLVRDDQPRKQRQRRRPLPQEGC